MGRDKLRPKRISKSTSVTWLVNRGARTCTLITAPRAYVLVPSNTVLSLLKDIAFYCALKSTLRGIRAAPDTDSSLITS